jgi:hypothetical protein
VSELEVNKECLALWIDSEIRRLDITVYEAVFVKPAHEFADLTQEEEPAALHSFAKPAKRLPYLVREIVARDVLQMEVSISGNLEIRARLRYGEMGAEMG